MSDLKALCLGQLFEGNVPYLCLVMCQTLTNVEEDSLAAIAASVKVFGNVKTLSIDINHWLVPDNRLHLTLAQDTLHWH